MKLLGYAFLTFIGLGVVAIGWYMATDDKRHPRTGYTPAGTPIVQCSRCDHPPFLGYFAYGAYVEHIQSDHIREVVGEVGE